MKKILVRIQTYKSIAQTWSKAKSRLAFTLAEVLVVMGIIGMVADLTLPSLMKDVMAHAFEQQKKIVSMKITEALNQMKANDVISGYGSTSSFSTQFYKYVKVIRKCTYTNLATCFPTIFYHKGETITANSLKTGQQLGIDSIQNNVGFVLADGTSIVMGYDAANCKNISPYDASTPATSCIAIIYDVNGFKQPNKLGQDIGSINAQFCIEWPVNNPTMCVATNSLPITPISEDPYTSNNNYWAGARDACLARGMRLPTQAEGLEILAHKAEFEELGLIQGWGGIMAWNFWTSREIYGHSAYKVGLNPNPYTDFTTKTNSGEQARCVMDL